MTLKDVVDLDEIYLRSACKSPARNTAYLTLSSSHCRSNCRPAHMTPNFLFFVWRKLAVIFNSAVYHIANQHGKISCSNLYKILCVAHVCEAALELIFHDTLIIFSPCMTTE